MCIYRRLPELQASLLPQVPADNSALHQGRMRTTPHIEGQFAAYVYVPLVLERSSALYKLLLKAYTLAQNIVPPLHPIGIFNDTDPSDGAKPRATHELHVSLTRPTYLNAHQRDEFKRAVKSMTRAHSEFTASFSMFAELTNDERTRIFLTLEIGAGHAELKALSDTLVPALRSIRQKEFYADPRFHASIAWALLDRSPSTPAPAQDFSSDIQSSTSSTYPLSTSEPTSPSEPVTPLRGSQGSTMPQFPTIPDFPPTLVESLNREFGGTLVSRQVGMFQVGEVCVRIGKEVSRWDLVG
ncbi:hypothetical protein BKA93DRAFT_741212 [Sparassis latifolia]